MAGNLKSPPKFEEGSSYETWKKDVRLWTKLTDLDKKKQGIAVYLSLTGQARSIVSEVSEDDFCKETGVDTVLEKLDSLFLADKSLRQFSAFNKLYNLRRNDNTPIGDFISEFEHVYFEFKGQEMTLPDSVQAFILLSACNLNENERKVVMSGIADVTYNDMKEALRRIFATELGSKKPIEIKNEPVFQSMEESSDQEALFSNKGRGSYRGSFRGRNRFRSNRGFKSNVPYSADSGSGRQMGKQTSQTEKYRRCFECGSKYHFVKDCPDAQKEKEKFTNDDTEVVHLSLFNGRADGNDRDSKLKILI